MTVRAISRAIAVLSVVNRDGPITMMEIARSANIAYATANRIIHTLIDEGMIEREPARKRYRVTSLVQTLSLGFQEGDALVAKARPHIEELCRETSWPVSLATRVGGRIILRDSTHAMTSLTFSNYHPGYTLPLAECATGKAYLAFCDDDERQAIIDGWEAIDNEAARFGLLLVGDDYMLEKIRTDGYATQARNVYNAEPGKTSSIAVPILTRQGKLVGSLAIVYFVAAMKVEDAVAQLYGPLHRTAGLIAAAMSEHAKDDA